MDIDLESLFSAAPSPYVLLDRDLRIVWMNRAYLLVTGRTKESLTGQKITEAFPADPKSVSEKMLRGSFARVLETGKIDHLPVIPYPIAGDDGQMRNMYWSATHTPICDPEGKVQYILQNTNDVSHIYSDAEAQDSPPKVRPQMTLHADLLRRAEEVSLRNLELDDVANFFRSIFDQAPSIISILTGPDHVYQFANQSYYAASGRKDVIGMTIREALPELEGQGFFEALDNAYRTGETIHQFGAPALVGQPDGTDAKYFLDLIYQPLKDQSGNVVGLFAQAHDITRQKQTEFALADLNETLEQRVNERNDELEKLHSTLRQSQKMEAVGNLAGGVAHDFNNLLQTITGSLQLAARELEPASPARPRLDLAMKAVDRGALLATQLLAFGRRQPLAPKVVNLGRLLQDASYILRTAVGEAVSVETIIPENLWNTFVDPANVENAILNMAINARDAMEGKGRLIVEAANVKLTEADARGNAEVEPGPYVRLSLTDSGCGMTPEVIEKVFEPFFTTKDPDKGTGLGMAMVYGFVKQSRGHVTISSTPGEGSTIRIFLPQSEKTEDAVAPAIQEEPRGGTETILLVEDDSDVRRVSAALLDDLGYTVLQATDADRAMIVIESGVAFDLLFTDVVMPGEISSREMAERAKALRPEVGVLFTSGFTQNSIVHGGRLDEGIELLSKPYTQETLARKLRDVLNKARGAVQRSPSVPFGQPAAAAHHPANAVPDERTAPANDSRSRFDGLRVLICEDDAIIRLNLAEVLELSGCQVISTATGRQALDQSEAQITDLLLLDVGLPDVSGVDLAHSLREHQPEAALIFATGDSTVEGIDALIGARVLQKPFGDEDLFRTMREVLERQS